MRKLLFVLAAILATAPSAVLLATPPTLRAMPASAAPTAAPGLFQPTPKSFAYVPKSVSGAAPLIVLMPASGEQAADYVANFKSEADSRGAILLALNPSESHWTLKPDGTTGADFGKDPANLDAALGALFAKARIDPARTVILGFADGASYALSVGIANPKLFRGVVALSPGTVWLASADSTQRIFITHGMRDAVLPFANSKNNVALGLQRAGLQVKTHWLNIGHQIDRRMVKEGLDYTLGVAR